MPEQKPAAKSDEQIEVVAKAATLVLIVMGAFMVYAFMTAPAITPQLQVGFGVGVFLLLEGTFLTVACNGWAIVRGLRRLYRKE